MYNQNSVLIVIIYDSKPPSSLKSLDNELSFGINVSF